MNNLGGWNQAPHNLVTIPAAVIAALPEMSAPELACTLVLAAATYGQGRSYARLTYDDFLERTMYKGSEAIARGLSAVVARGLFCRTDRSMWEIAQPRAGEGGAPACAVTPALREEHPAISEENASPSEVKASLSEVVASISEVNASPRTVEASLSEVVASISEVNASPRTVEASLSEVETSISEVKAGAGVPAEGTESEPPNGPDGTKSVPLPYSKEIDPLAGDLERERKKRASDRDHSAAPRQSPSPPRIPRARSAKERALAGHPAAKSWLDSGQVWPGWAQMRLIAQRMGERPQTETLRRAYEMWLMHGYRPNNIQGILDWYEALCRDGAWQPYAQAGPSSGGTLASQRQQSFDLLDRMRQERTLEGMDLLLHMREERLREQEEDAGPPDRDASSRASPGPPAPEDAPW